MPRKRWRAEPSLRHPYALHWALLRDAIGRYAPRCTGRLIDYGCGSKPYRHLFTHATQYIGVDHEVQDPGDLALTPTGGIPAEDATADGVLSFQVLEHVPDVSSYLSECLRVLRPEGRLLLSTHGVWPYHPGPGFDDYRRWTEPGLRRLMEEHAFDVLAIDGLCGGVYCLLQQVMALRPPPGQKRKGRGNRVWSACVSAINGLSFSLLNLIGPGRPRCDILPIVYLVEARKPTHP